MSRRRRDDWSAPALPGLRRAYLRALEVRQYGLHHADPDWLRRLGIDDIEQAAAATRDGAAHEAWTAKIADLYWVTIDMAKVALDASTDVPDLDLAAALPSPHGIMAFSAPLPPVPADHLDALAAFQDRSLEAQASYKAAADPLPTDAIAWSRNRDFVHITPLTRASRDPGNIALIGHFIQGNAVRVPGSGQIADRDPTARALAAFLQSASTLMAMPTVAEIRDQDPRSGETRASTPASQLPEGDVRIVDLRPMKHVRLEGEAADHHGREYRHRWVVRGHWRQQAVGPKRGQRQTTWIPSYIKGPDGAPLLSRETVMVWRR